MKKILLQSLAVAQNGLNKHSQWTQGKLHWSFLIQGGIVGHARNISASPLTHLGYSDKQKRHSETEVFYNYKGKLDHEESYDMINVRLSRQGELKLSYPCETCWKFLRNTGCKFIWFSTPHGFVKERIQ